MHLFSKAWPTCEASFDEDLEKYRFNKLKTPECTNTHKPTNHSEVYHFRFQFWQAAVGAKGLESIHGLKLQNRKSYPLTEFLGKGTWKKAHGFTSLQKHLTGSLNSRVWGGGGPYSSTMCHFRWELPREAWMLILSDSSPPDPGIAVPEL